MTTAYGQPAGLKAASVLTIFSIVAVLAIYHGTVVSMIRVWQSSETYAHGWIILPLSAWLIWRQRGTLAVIAPQFSPWGLVMGALTAALWLAADIIDVQVVKHFCLVAFIWSTVLTLLGGAITRQLLFPLGFLAFAVPVGEILIPTLMEITAWFSINAIRLTGVPVYRDGMFFALPSGDFEIAVACSGIRYLIASVALGTLFAYLSFHTLWKRLTFVGLSIVVPVVANGIRAYLIVMIAHLSDMKLAVGIDHFIYGWVFFGIVMFVLFMIGARFQEDPGGQQKHVNYIAGSSGTTLAAACVLLLATVYAVPVLGQSLRPATVDQSIPVGLPAATADWQGPLPVAIDYQPDYPNRSLQLSATYQRADGEQVHLFIEYFDPADARGELVNDLNRVYGDDWIREDIGVRRSVMEGAHQVIETPVRRRATELIIWHWYELSSGSTVSGTRAKLLKLRDTLLGRFGGSAMIAVVAQIDYGESQTHELLEEFLEKHLGSIRACLQLGTPGEACELR